MNESDAGHANLVPGEYIDETAGSDIDERALSDGDINSKYVKGEVRIVTEQARYPINSIANIVEDPS